ncbi:hypothetical protein CMI48_03885 [Candidatus Pacearchaeota archaeon]|nr:hypothetical protein [Candidatus Pacearchaeota archaeon]|tara:strand:- start:230 stop:463 length:234 start_codon:yes stop_codon:yes gene_type:complete
MKLQDIIIILLFITSLLIASWYFFGNSPTFEQAILVLIPTLLITQISETKETKVKVNLIERSFVKLANDFKEHSKHH